MKRGGEFFFSFLWGGGGGGKGGQLTFYSIFSGGKKYAGRYDFTEKLIKSIETPRLSHIKQDYQESMIQGKIKQQI